MRRLLLSVIALLGISTSISAQKKGDVEFGFNVGYNSSSVSDDYDSSDASAGFNVAGSIDYYFTNSWSIKTKLIYDQKGWDNGFIEDSNGSAYSTDFNLNYVTIPVMASWHFGNNRNWYLHFGPYMGFLLNAEDVRYNTDVTDAFNSNDFGLALGIGVKVPVSDKVKLFFELDGQGGFNDIFRDNYYSSVTNSRTSLNIGFNFLLK
ncbi:MULTISPECIES: porin family protein [Flavobacterium]|uniref:Porin family protein n=1 Tax=Flavobacterium sedimenticola TaxID=3043286 RepID=A0ABT6XPC4_9FLAO|nr:porin family protein [Flavobacterium sedimenticola]MDI9256944.1 porin family protein [Flavobacterium sedimenticola]